MRELADCVWIIQSGNNYFFLVRLAPCVSSSLCFGFKGSCLQVMMNAMDVPSKRSTLERRLDKLILLLFGILFVLCLIGGMGRLGPTPNLVPS